MKRRTILKRTAVGVATGGLVVGTASGCEVDEDCILDHCNQECPDKCCGACYC